MSEKYSVEAILSLRDQGFTSGMEKASGVMGKMRGGVGGIVGGITKMASAFGIGTLAADGLKSAMRTVTGSIDGAISRVDTLDNADRVFANMGFAAKDTAVMMDNLNESITGLPTTLDGAIRNVQTLASATQDVKGSEEIFSALNNAVLGFGGSAEGVDSVVNMFSRSLARGKMQADEWNTMFDQMGPVLNAVAQEMGYTATELREGLSAGEIELDSFTEALLKLNKEGGGGLVSLEQIAQDSTKGIRTSFTNAKTAITRGVATIIQSLNEGLENAGLMNISEMLTAWGASFNKVLLLIADNLDPLINIVANVVDAFRSLAEGFMSTTDFGVQLQNMFTKIQSAFENVVGSLFSGGIDINSIFQRVGETLGQATSKVIKFVTNIADYIRQMDIAGAKNEIFARLRSLLNSIDWQRLKELAITLKDGVGNAIMFVVEKVQELWAGFRDSGAIDAIIQAFKDFKEMVVSNIESFSDLTGNMRDGSISFESVGRAIGKVVEVGAKFLSWLYKASASVSTFLSKVNPNVILGVVGAFAGFKILARFNPFKMFQRNAKKGIDGVGRDAKRGGGIIQQIFVGIGSVIESVATAIGTVLTSLSTAISTVATGIAQALSIALRGLASAIRMIPIPHMLSFAAAVGIVVAALALLATQGDGVKKMLEGVAEVVERTVVALGVVLVASIEAVGRVLEEHADSIVKIIEAIAEGFGTFAESVGKAMATVVEAFEPLYEIMVEGLTKIVEILSEAFVEVVEILSEYIPDIIDFFSQLVEAIPEIIEAFGNLATSISEAVATIVEAVGEQVQGIIRAFGDVFEQVGGVIVNIIGAVNDALPNFQAFVTAVIESLGEALPPIIEAFGEVFKDVGEAVEGVIDAFGRNEPQITNFTETIIEAFGGVVVEIIEAFEKAFESMGEVVEGIIDAWGRNAPTFAESVDTVITSMSDGAVAVIDAFKDAFSEMGDTIVGVVESLEGYMKTLGEVINGVIETLGGEIRSTMKTFGETWTDMGETVEGVINAMSKHNTALSEAINGIIETLAGEIRSTIDSFTESFEKIGDTIEGVIQKIGDVSEQVAGSVSEFADAVDKLANVDWNFIVKMSGFVGLLLALVPIRNQISQAATATDELAEAFERMDKMNDPTGIITTFEEALQNIVDQREPFLSLLSAINEEFSNLTTPINAARMMLDDFRGAVESTTPVAKEFDQQILNMVNNVETNMKDMSKAFQDSFKTVQNDAKRFLQDLVSSFRTSITTLRTLTQQGLSQIAETFKTNFQTMRQNVQNDMRLISTLITNALRTITTLSNSGLRQVSNAFTTNMNSSVRTVRNAMNSIINSMRSIVGQARNAGYNVGIGFNNGLASTSGRIMATARNIANNVAATMRRALQVRSPSRVTESIGEDTGLGFYGGLENMLPKIVKMSRMIAETLDIGNMLDKFNSDAFNNLNGFTTDFTARHSDFNHQVTGQSLNLNVRIGNHDYKLFVEDISQEQQNQAILERY